MRKACLTIQTKCRQWKAKRVFKQMQVKRLVDRSLAATGMTVKEQKEASMCFVKLGLESTEDILFVTPDDLSSNILSPIKARRALQAVKTDVEKKPSPPKQTRVTDRNWSMADTAVAIGRESRSVRLGSTPYRRHGRNDPYSVSYDSQNGAFGSVDSYSNAGSDRNEYREPSRKKSSKRGGGSAIACCTTPREDGNSRSRNRSPDSDIDNEGSPNESKTKVRGGASGSRTRALVRPSVKNRVRLSESLHETATLNAHNRTCCMMMCRMCNSQTTFI